MNFATDGPGIFTLMAYENSTLVGQVSATGVIPPGFFFPEGTISFNGVTLNSVVLSSPATPYFAIDNVDVQPVPEPATMTLLASGLAGLLGSRRKRCAVR